MCMIAFKYMEETMHILVVYMEKKRNLDEVDKIQIARLYHYRNFSIGTISQILNFSKQTIRKYKNYKIDIE